MNKVVTSASLLALGAAAAYGYDPELTHATSGRIWSITAVVRGFYDSNPTTTPDKSPISPGPKDSFGYEVGPSVHLNLPLEQTFIRAGYNYSLRYFEDREPHNYDQSHEFDALLRHAFSPRQDISVAEGFVYSSEPSVVDRSGIQTTVRRTDETGIHNHGDIEYNAGLSQRISLNVGYVNDWYDYNKPGPASRSALLDRIEQFIHIDGRYQISPTLVGILGYQLGLRDYIADEYMFGDLPRRTALQAQLEAQGLSTAEAFRAANAKSDRRDSVTHFIYVGADYDFTAKLRGSLRIGGEFTDYVNANTDDVSPFADASMTYAFRPASSLRVGVRHTRAATDVNTPDRNGRPTLDQEATAGYIELTHQFTRDFSASLLGEAQYATFNNGANDDDSEILYQLGINFNYRINLHWSVEAGYNYDLLDSDVTLAGEEVRSFDRSRVYLGVRATY